MSYLTTEVSQQKAARVAGFMYLFALATAIFASFYVRASLETGNAAETANNIMTSESLFRIGLASDLVAFTSVVLLALTLYIVVEQVNRVLALLALFWWLGEAFVLAVNTLNDYIVLILLSNADYLSVFEPGQLEAMVQVFISAHGTGYNIGLIFFCLGSAIYSYLLFKSNFVPRILAALGIFASLSMLIGTFAILIAPHGAGMIYQLINPPMALYELAIGLWLLFVGVSVHQQDGRGEKEAPAAAR